MTAQEKAKKVSIHSLVERFFQGDTRAELQLKKRIAAIVRRYPPADYCLEGKWSDENIEQICSSVWEKMIERGIPLFWYRSGADEKRIKLSFKNLIFNEILKTATPEQRHFINTVVNTYRKNKKLFTKKRIAGQLLMGMTVWKKQNRPVSTQTRDELLNLWRENINWPNMARVKVKPPDSCRLFKEMLELVMEWVLDSHFYNNYRKLINFPRPGMGIKLEEDDHESLNLDLFLKPHDRDRLDIDGFDKSSKLIAENKTLWQKRISEVFSSFRDDERQFLYYLCHYGMRATHAAAKVGRSPSFGTTTMNRLHQFFSDFRETLDPEELPAMSRYLAENLKSLLEGKIE